MRSYWDSSAIINAAVSAKVLARLDSGNHFSRLHSLAEFFSIMTGRGILASDDENKPTRVVFAPQECAAWLREFASKVRFVELRESEVLAGLDDAQERGVQGARIYDYWHALAYKKARADELLTRNTDDFRGLADKVTWP